MTDRYRLEFRKGDVIAVFIVIALIIAVWFFVMPDRAAEGASVAVYLDGKLINELPLNTDAEFTVRGEYENVISISGGRVSVVSSDCPGGDCVHSGSIKNVGRSIVCLPNRMEIRINGAPDDGGVDFVVG